MKTLLAQLVQGTPLSQEQAVQAFELIMTGQATPAQVGALLSLIQLRGATEDELTGAAMVMRSKSSKVSVPAGLTVIDTCGTGGDHANTFNISTAAAIVAAGAGRKHHIAVAKHGNRSVTSKSGSSQVLEALGVKLQVTDATLSKCLVEAGVCFCFAPAHHPAMKHAVPIRQDLGFRTIFNLLGPLTNPAGAKRQVIGVFSDDLIEPIARVLRRLGAEHAMVVHGSVPGGGLDELSTCGPTMICHVQGGRVFTSDLDPTSLGLSLAHPASLQVDGPEQSAQVIRDVLSGTEGTPRDIVCLNAAAALLVGGLATDLQEGLQLAGEAIDSGEAKKSLDSLIQFTQAST